jgi:hypothetical protein
MEKLLALAIAKYGRDDRTYVVGFYYNNEKPMVTAYAGDVVLEVFI